MMMQKFWMVLGNGTPTYRHGSIVSAKVEAERLANLNRGHEFTILESVGHVVRADLIWTRHNDDQQTDEIPF